MKKFGKTEQAVYEFVKDYIRKNSISPSIREIGEALSLNSTSTVHFHLKSLESKGLILLSKNKQRAIRLSENKPDYTLIPLVGTVAAGSPIFAFDDISEYYPLPHSLLRGVDHRDVFMLTVNGDSMINAGILDGDAVIVNKGISVNSGDIVVARIFDDSATVKRFYYDESQKKIKLQPENDKLEPIIVDFDDVTIVGKVIGVFRKYL